MALTRVVLVVISHLLAVCPANAGRLMDVAAHVEADQSLSAQKETALRAAELKLFLDDAPKLAQDFVQHALMTVLEKVLEPLNPYAKGMLKMSGGYSKALCEPEEAFGEGQADDDARHRCLEPITHPNDKEDRQYLSYESVAKLLTKVPKKQREGTVTRGNELGLFRLGSELWSKEKDAEDRKIGLGAPAEKHEMLRPIFDKVLVSGHDTWTEGDLQKSVGRFMKGKWLSASSSFPASDVATWTINILHKIHFGFELDVNPKKGFQVEDFLSFQKKALAESVLLGLTSEIDWKVKLLAAPMRFAGSLATDLWHYLTQSGIANAREQWIDFYMDSLQGKPKEIIEERDEQTNIGKDVALKGLLESLLFAGGLSVPSLIKVGLAVLYSSHSPMNSTAREALLNLDVTTEGDRLDQFAFEVARMYPAVVGFPFYHKVNGQKEPRHYIGNVAMAMRDPEVFVNPRTFNLDRNLTLLRQKMGMAWAEPANGEDAWDNVQKNPNDWSTKKFLTEDSHGCPGEALSFAMMKAFFKQWIAMLKDFTVEVDPQSDKEFVDHTPFAPDLQFSISKK